MNTLTPVGGLFRKAWSIYTERFRTLFILVVVSWLLGLVTAAAIAPSALGAFLTLRDGFIPSATELGILGVSGIWGLIVVIASLLVSIWIQIAMMYGVSEEGAGQKPADLLRRSSAMILPFLLVSILTVLAILGGIILLVIPGLIFALWFWMSTYVVLFEHKKGTEAMRQSRRYAKGVMWPMLGRFAFIILLAMLVGVVVSVIERPLGLERRDTMVVDGVERETRSPGIINSTVFSVLGPLFYAYAYLLYRDVKKTKEVASTEATQPSAQT